MALNYNDALWCISRQIQQNSINCMDTIELCSQLEKVTYAVEVIQNDEKVSSGSAVAFTENGYLLTAAHVVARLTHIEKDLSEPNTVVIARTKSLPYHPYHVGLCAPTITLDDYLRRPLIIDLAVLIPMSLQTAIPFLEVQADNVQVGEQVLMAGFPDEMELPFSFDKLLNYSHPEVRQQSKNVEIARRVLMIKSGMIGHKSGFNIHATNNTIINGEVFYVDNVMHSGASGGPIISDSGKIIGIITQRAITPVPFKETPNLRVPSGSCVALTPRTILNLL